MGVGQLWTPSISPRSKNLDEKIRNWTHSSSFFVVFYREVCRNVALIDSSIFEQKDIKVYDLFHNRNRFDLLKETFYSSYGLAVKEMDGGKRRNGQDWSLPEFDAFL